uniref:30S ribosomal protein S12 methylthiotransferase RimO n=1 Tax=Vaginimicrobium propionicum TaxID=1871034 RepID=UPI000970ABE2|nr:30S ribosomal protein S12 methylthiotransferase RimO [Vaginimicrobium propionicum]
MKKPTVCLVTLGCARNDVDSEELAANLDAGGFTLVTDASEAEVIVVNTCGFIDAAKKDSIDTLLAASDAKVSGKAKAVVAVGCMAERYGGELAQALPEADAVLGFDDYEDIAARLRKILGGEQLPAPTPIDRRTLLPLAPIKRSVRQVMPKRRRRLDTGPYAPLKIASGCDRRCAFCAIPRFRGAYLSRAVAEITDEAAWLVDNGVREIMLVSENTSSYGKDFGDRQGLIPLLKELNQLDGLERIRVSYLQPAEIYPGLIETMCCLEHVVNYFDISFQHAAPTILRRMRRFGDPDNFMSLIDKIRQLAPEAGIRSNFIVGFPGESDEDYRILRDFVQEANLDVAGVFGYSDEENTEAYNLSDHISDELIAERVEDLSELANHLVDQRASQRIGQRVRVLVERVADGQAVGRSEHQGPQVDGETTLPTASLGVGDIVEAEVTDSFGADLIANNIVNVIDRRP